MKKIFKTLPLALIVMSIYSCTSDDETVQDVKDNSSVVTTFTCTQENDGTTTKAALNSDSKTILWKTGDAISIFGNDNKNYKYELDSESDEKSTGTFSGTGADTAPYVAVYPYTAGATLGEDGKSVSNIVLPDEQNAVDNGFDPNAVLMIAKSTTTSLQFKNAVGFIKVTPQFECKKIILRAADKTEPLAGKGTLKFDESDNPYIDFTDSKELTYSITLSGTITSGNAYYIAVPAVTLSENWTLTFVTEGKNYMRKVNKTITFKRSKALNLGTFAKDGDNWVTDPRGIVDPSQEVDMDLKVTIGTTTYNVIFAKTNLTATGLADNETDYGDYFAWGTIEPWCTAYTREGATKVTPTEWKTDKSGGYISYNCPSYNNDDYVKDGVLKMEYDPARQILGGDWQLPTKDIWVNLYDNGNNTKWEWTTQNSYNGRKVTNETDNSKSIFLPAAGYVDGTLFYTVGSYGNYWSGTVYSSTDAYLLDFYSGSVNAQINYYRYYGFSVRPVRLVAE